MAHIWRRVEKFESELTSYVGVKVRDEVLIVSNAGINMMAACRNIDAHPVYARIDKETVVMSAASASDATSRRAKAVSVTRLSRYVTAI